MPAELGKGTVRPDVANRSTGDGHCEDLASLPSMLLSRGICVDPFGASGVLLGEPSASGSGSACHLQKPAFLDTPGGEPERRTDPADVACRGTDARSGDGGATADLGKVGWLAFVTMGEMRLPDGDGTLTAEVVVAMRRRACFGELLAVTLPAEATFSDP